MKKAKLFLLASMIFGTIICNAQTVEMDNGKVTCNGKEILNYKVDKWGTYQVHFYSLDSNEIILVSDIDNETPKYYEDDFTSIKFLQLGKKVETKVKKNKWKHYLVWFIENKVMDTEGKINEEKLDLFIKNYDEKITERTIKLK